MTPARVIYTRTGRALLVAVGVFGLATIVFGVSRSFPLSLAAYVIAGMADQVSVVMRQTALMRWRFSDELSAPIVSPIGVCRSSWCGSARAKRPREVVGEHLAVRQSLRRAAEVGAVPSLPCATVVARHQ